MYKMCKSETAALRQKQIANCMIQLWRRQSYQQVSVSEICKLSDIPRKTFYRYFDSKEDVFLFICENLILEYQTYLGPYTWGESYTMQKDIEKFFMFNREQEKLWELVQRDNMVQRVIEHVVAKMVEMQAKGGEQRRLEDEAVHRMRITFFMHGLFAIFLGWKQCGYAIPEKQAAEAAVRLVSAPLYEW